MDFPILYCSHNHFSADNKSSAHRITQKYKYLFVCLRMDYSYSSIRIFVGRRIYVCVDVNSVRLWNLDRILKVLPFWAIIKWVIFHDLARGINGSDINENIDGVKITETNRYSNFSPKRNGEVLQTINRINPYRVELCIRNDLVDHLFKRIIVYASDCF